MRARKPGHQYIFPKCVIGRAYQRALDARRAPERPASSRLRGASPARSPSSSDTVPRPPSPARRSPTLAPRRAPRAPDATGYLQERSNPSAPTAALPPDRPRSAGSSSRRPSRPTTSIRSNRNIRALSHPSSRVSRAAIGRTSPPRRRRTAARARSRQEARHTRAASARHGHTGADRSTRADRSTPVVGTLPHSPAILRSQSRIAPQSRQKSPVKRASSGFCRAAHPRAKKIAPRSTAEALDRASIIGTPTATPRSPAGSRPGRSHPAAGCPRRSD